MSTCLPDHSSCCDCVRCAGQRGSTGFQCPGPVTLRTKQRHRRKHGRAERLNKRRRLDEYTYRRGLSDSSSDDMGMADTGDDFEPAPASEPVVLGATRPATLQFAPHPEVEQPASDQVDPFHIDAEDLDYLRTPLHPYTRVTRMRQLELLMDAQTGSKCSHATATKFTEACLAMLPEDHDAASSPEVKKWTERLSNMDMQTYDMCPDCGYVYYDSPRRPEMQQDTRLMPDGSRSRRLVCGRAGCSEERWADRVLQTPRKRLFYLPLRTLISAHMCRTDLLANRRKSHVYPLPSDGKGATDVHETRGYQRKMATWPDFAASVRYID